MSTIEFNHYFEHLQDQLLPFAYRLTNNVDDAKDLIQETAIRAFNNKEKFEVGTNFKAWMITIMRNTFINIYRKKKGRATSSEPGDSHVFINDKNVVVNSAESNIMMAELVHILENLDNTYRKPFQMYYEGYKYEEIAENMDLPLGTVKSRIFFARQKLRDSVLQRYPLEVN